MANVYTKSYSYTADDLKDYEIQRNLIETDIKKVTYSLSLDTDTAVNLYITPAEGYTGDVTAKLGDKDLEVVKTGERCKVTISGISAHLLG